MQHTKEVLIGVGLTIAIAVVAGAILGSSSISQAQSESVDLVSIELKKGTSGTALLSVKIKNNGNSPVSTITGQLNFDTVAGGTVNPYTFTFLPTDLEPGATTTHVGDVTGSTTMSTGESFTLSISGTTSQGSVIQTTGVATVSRF